MPAWPTSTSNRSAASSSASSAVARADVTVLVMRLSHSTREAGRCQVSVLTRSDVAEPVEAIEDEVEPELEFGGGVVPRLGDVATDDLDEVRVVAQHGLVLAHLPARFRGEVGRGLGRHVSLLE